MPQPELSKRLLIKNKLGLHARAASKVVKLAQQYDATILIQQEDKSASADSIMGLLMLESSQGKNIEVKCSGPDAREALEALEALVDDNFDESE
ncbi:HPr family phosphocarrier protein [Flocculibacter collagenilyticus]|uniref:HPr family phosphocarrier protein n=1 Tax=Flocculibacter collagenilyticus TaxID=2744479 RepID=UPI0018F4FABF|nr:HPr family phosphocarrier protein [Flocculibacter collagenilyticus]